MVFEVTRQKDIFRGLCNDHKFHISDDLLLDCIGLGCGNSLKDGRVQGFNSGKGFGYALLTYFASMALGFRRLPFCEDRIYTNFFGQTEQFKQILGSLSTARIECIVNEVKELYKHTQSHLQNLGLNSVNIRREIKCYDKNAYFDNYEGDPRGYAETLVQLRRACDVLCSPSIQVEMDTLNSFGDEGAYSSPVRFERSVPAEDILYCSALVGDRDGEPRTMESGEWVVINRSPTGIVNIPSTSIVFNPKMWKWDKTLTEMDAKAFLDRYQPIVFRSLSKSRKTYGTHGVRPSIRGKIAMTLLKLIAGHDER